VLASARPRFSAVPALEFDGAICKIGGMSPSSKTPPINEIATVRIELRYTDPVIWREVEVPTSIKLTELHDIIQAAMGWDDSHLWEFTIDKQRYGLPTDDDWGYEPCKPASKVRLRDVLRPRRTTIDYIYDFGDSWKHRLTATRIRAGDPDISYPRYVGGERNGPPEDCGGTPGFYDLLDALSDPQHPNHADVKEWGGAYDPEVIEETAIKSALDRIASRRKTRKTPPAEKAGKKQ
jgi:Plasmid pRiA4b ORF-3-like protein